jgi:polyhydroxybutyrate depolymerase
MLSLLAAIIVLTPIQKQEVRSFELEGVKREALVYLPSVKTEHPPLVFGFHGHGGNMYNAARSFQMHELWPEAVVVYMQGLPTPGALTDPKGEKNGWQSKAEDIENRDLKFFDVVYDRAVKEFQVNTQRVYAMGHSNGGAFTYLLWATRANKFAAFGPSGAVASVYRGQLVPKPAFIVSGEQDQLVRPIAQQFGIRYVKSLNGVEGDVKMGTVKGSKADLGLYIHPGNHTYPREANKLMVEFFKSHPKG